MPKFPQIREKREISTDFAGLRFTALGGGGDGMERPVGHVGMHAKPLTGRRRGFGRSNRPQWAKVSYVWLSLRMGEGFVCTALTPKR